MARERKRRWSWGNDTFASRKGLERALAQFCVNELVNLNVEVLSPSGQVYLIAVTCEVVEP